MVDEPLLMQGILRIRPTKPIQIGAGLTLSPARAFKSVKPRLVRLLDIIFQLFQRANFLIGVVIHHFRQRGQVFARHLGIGIPQMATFECLGAVKKGFLYLDGDGQYGALAFMGSGPIAPRP